MSLISSIFYYKEENSRSYYSFYYSKYVLLNDKEE